MLSPAMIKKANEWRAKNPELKGGVIVIHNRKVQGWVNELRNPESWVAGCIAIDADGHQYRATGGDDYNGAERWELIAVKTTKQAN